MAEAKGSTFVFLDARGRRWPRLRRVLVLASIIVFLGMVLFVQSLFVTPQLRLPPSVLELKSRLKALQKQSSEPLLEKAAPLWLKFSRKAAPAGGGQHPVLHRPGSGVANTAQKEVRMGFYVGWDRDSYDSLAAHAGQLTHVCSEWMTVVDGTGTLVSAPDPQVQTFAQRNGIVLLPLLSNLTDDTFLPEAVEGLANGPELRQDGFIAALIGQLKAAGAGGVVVDWAQLDPYYRQAVTKLLRRMAAALHAEKLELWLCIPMGLELEVFDLEALAPSVDRFIAVLHDQNSEHDPPGPIASQDWFEGWLQAMVGYGSPQQWIIDIGSYGYDWAAGEEQAETIGFRDIMTRAGHAGVQHCRMEAPLYNPHFSYEDAGTRHSVWFLDAATFINQVRIGRKHLTGGVAISRLGMEDPGIWEALPLVQSEKLAAARLAPLQTLKADGAVAHVGKGEFLTVDDSLADGSRGLSMDAAGRIVEDYRSFPKYLTICHQGQGRKDEVAISFDDGPDPEWTPRILDILRERGVKASFFVVGQKVEKNPELASRIVREGHEIGVHTYTHPNLAEVSEERAVLEFNSTQRLIEAVTGRSTQLFRPPYNAESHPHEPAEIVPLRLAQQLGYLTVMQDIDPEDWAQPGADVILQRTKRLRRLGGNIVLLHDAGGDRRQTVEALPRIIDYIEARGDRIVPLGRLLGESPQVLMPPVLEDQQEVTRFVSESGFRIMFLAHDFLWAFVMVATALIVLRTLTVVLFAFANGRRKRRDEAPFHPPVSVLMAAYNEAKVIESTLAALLDTDYPGELEVVVVDDGSMDDTGLIVARMAKQDARLRLIRQPNQGKAAALRNGLEATTHELIVTLDADTQFQRGTIRELIQPLADERVGAVSGRAKVGNLRTFIARCQALEYTCGFNLDRRAYHQLDCITVVPGAVSALRRSAVLAAGGISTDTLAEDTDLTLALHRQGYRVVYAPDAVAWTEAPETIHGLAKQRFRWAFGTLQCLWKHRDLVFNPRCKALGWFSLPGIWFFQILLVAFGPVLDALLILSLLLGASSTLFMYFLVFLLMDLFLAALACLLERESLRQVWLTIPMRLIYRALLSWVMWKSILRAVQGAWVNWGKLERTASLAGVASQNP